MNPPAPTVLITGAGQRIGRAVALDLAEAGWSIALHYNSSSKGAEGVCEQIRAHGGVAEIFQANFQTAGQTGLMAKITDKLGPVSALINCASVFENDSAISFSDEDWHMHMDVNLKAPLQLAQEFAQALPSPATGAIVNFTDQRVLKPTPEFFTYTLSKLALWQATRTLAQAFAPRIRVNAIAPGPTLSNARQTPKDFAAQCEATLLGTGSPVEEICTGVRYLLDAKAVTGQTLLIDGGQHLIWQTPDIVGINE